MYIFMLVSSIILITALLGIFYIKNVYAEDLKDLENIQKTSTDTRLQISNATNIDLDGIILKNNSERKK